MFDSFPTSEHGTYGDFAVDDGSDGEIQIYEEESDGLYSKDDNDDEEEEDDDDDEDDEDEEGGGKVASLVSNQMMMKYGLVASKQMVGIFLTVWMRKELIQHVTHLRISCVTRGIMGCLGNKVQYFYNYHHT